MLNFSLILNFKLRQGTIVRTVLGNICKITVGVALRKIANARNAPEIKSTPYAYNNTTLINTAETQIFVRFALRLEVCNTE